VVVSFATDVFPIFASCVGCHSAPGSDGLDLTTDAATAYTEIVIELSPNEGARIDLGTPANSLIYGKPQGLFGHGGGDLSLAPADLLKILDWITQGAINN